MLLMLLADDQQDNTANQDQSIRSEAGDVTGRGNSFQCVCEINRVIDNSRRSC